MREDISLPNMTINEEWECVNPVRDISDLRRIFPPNSNVITSLMYGVIYLLSLQVHTTSLRYRQENDDYIELPPLISIINIPARIFPHGEIIFEAPETANRHVFHDNQYVPARLSIFFH